MAAIAAHAPVASDARAVTLGEAAWIASTPCALITAAAMVLLGPWLGHRFFTLGSDVIFPEFELTPRPVGHACYIIALLGVGLLASAVAVVGVREIRLTARAIRILTWTSQIGLFAFLAVCLAAENEIVLRTYLPPQSPGRFFNLQTLLTAVAAPGVVLIALRSRRVRDRLASLVRETWPRRGASMVVASALAALWLVTGVDSDRTIATSLDSVLIQWPLNETFAVLDGRTPLVNFRPQYAQLIEYPVALSMKLFGATLFVWTVTMATISWCSMVAVYATFRRTVRNSMLALALYAPFVGMTYFLVGTRTHRLSPAGIFSLWPIRYAGPYLIVWLVSRNLDALRPKRAWLLFLASGLVALNNPEFGVGAVVGTLLALACQRSSHSRQGAVRLLASAASGLLGALALVALLTLTRAGQLPHLGFLLEYPRLFGLGGWHAWPLRPYGFHVAAYFTFTAAIVVAVVRAGNRHEDALLTGMLAWIGSFGLIAGSYYVGESEPGNMLALFSAWFFALAMLVVVVARGLAARGWRRPTLMELTVLFGFALSLNAILQIPDPRFEVRRLRQHALSSPLIPETGSGTIAQWTKPGERVAILVQLSERIAYELGIVNVSPYMYAQAIPTRETLQNVIDAVRAEHVHKIFIEEQSTTPAQLALLRRAGFTEHGSGILMDVSE